MQTNPSVQIQTEQNRAARELALRAMSEVAVEATSLVSYTSRGSLLIIGASKAMLAAAEALAGKMDTTVLLTLPPEEAPWHAGMPKSVTLIHGELEALSGHLGNFTAKARIKGQLADLAKHAQVGRAGFDVVLDLGKPASIQRGMLPFGYYAPGEDASLLQQTLEELPTMVGEFEKPKFFNYNPDICAHGRSGLIACQRCLDACPAEAITSLADRISVDPFLCQGGGSCATACPSGAISYAYPSLADSIERLRQLLSRYRAAGGKQASLLIHDSEEGLEHWTRLEGRLGGHVLPYPVEEIGSVGMEVWLAALAYGAEGVVLMTSKANPKQVLETLDTQLSYAHSILSGMGYAPERLRRVDAEQLVGVLAPQQELTERIEPADFPAGNDKRSVLRQAVDHLYAQSGSPQTMVGLPPGAPFGEVQVVQEKCTLCMACVSVCPSAALTDGGDRPQLKFREESCVQCGLCSKACPETALSLNSRFLYDTQLRAGQRILNEEQPFHCLSCGKAFATQSMIDNITRKLQGHSMFQGEQMKRLQMCEDCRVRDMFKDDWAASR